MQEMTTPPPAPQPPRRPSVVGPAILIILGLAFLAQNLGFFEYNIWSVLWRLWPVWLIAVGLDIMLGRRTSWGSWVVLGLVFTIIGGAVWFDASFGFGPYTSGEPVTVSQPVGNARQAEVLIDSSVAELQIRAGNPSTLVEGTVMPMEQERIEKDARTSGDTLHFALRSRGQGPTFGIPFNVTTRDLTWDLRLSDQIPIDLQIDTGVGESFIDLSGIKLTGLDVDTGVGETEITLPAQGRFRVDIDSGVGELTLRIPKELAVRIHADQGIGEVNIRGDFSRQGKAYVSSNYDSAADRVDIEIDGGVGEILVEQF